MMSVCLFLQLKKFQVFHGPCFFLETWPSIYTCYAFLEQCPECSTTEMGEFPICQLEWDLLRTSIKACTVDKNIFSASFGIFLRGNLKRDFPKSHIQTPNGVFLISKLPFPNGSYRNAVCRALWAMSFQKLPKNEKK